MKYQQFIFENYQFDAASKTLALNYSLDGALTFTETYRFDFDFASYDNAQLDRAIQNLFFLAGVSYYKTYLPPEIVVNQGQIDSKLASFLAKTYQKGLGEFFYINQLDPNTPINFPVNANELAPVASEVASGLLVGLGGGKDSLVSIELLRDQPRVASWSLDHSRQLGPLAERTGLPHFAVERVWDRKLLELKSAGALNGHVPISAIFAAVGTVVGILAGYNASVVSNENSANEPTLSYRGTSINHQYSKSLDFEQDYQHLLAHCFGASLCYFSFLRPLSELAIAEAFASYFDKYHDVFSSCNRAFTHDSPGLYWDASCPKCAFVFLALTPFVAREKLENLFAGKNLLLDASLEPTYRQLLGIEGDKPLECVGEIKESRAAMRLASKVYPELAQKYQFDLPASYDFRLKAAHSMPLELFNLLEARTG